MGKKIVFILGVVLTIVACNNASKYKSELDVISSYLIKLDSLESEINGIDFDSLVYIQNVAERNEKIIKTHYVPDTIDVVFAEKLNLNKGVRKSLKSVEKQKGDMLKEIKALTLQFSNLQKDIIEGQYTKDQIKDYLNVEKLDYDILELSFMDFNLNRVKQKNNFYYANPQISEYVEILVDEFDIP